MKFIIQVILTIFSSYILHFVMPWWGVAVSSFFISVMIKVDSKINAFLGGFTGICFLWMVYAAIIDVRTNFIISSKIAQLFGFSSSILLVLITGIIGGIVGGLSSISGYFFKEMFKEEEEIVRW